MAKQRNSLGLCILNAETTGVSMSYEQYKELYGIDLNTIFYYHLGDENAYFRPSFSKILCVDFKPLAKRLGREGMSKGNILVVNPSNIVLSGDSNEVIIITSGEFEIRIDTINKTIVGGES